ncbi:autophagy-related protein 9 [Cynara cardunculus var. scolymus]|uniref:autophagy-related protein 9 n=1 Tax=Cynara cardunculus var. scolymus TaxID=59895 RepID=UPI000D630029|nr:autophagy-related protein 9 [Cynara cardunculus var. scolymus]XP_024981210.1 autophagy-related protein 9 [Cynara cardunculus var. scolymus]XP_024981212.1 autophagy-related protein 9 [Cynara cardunculus var. scolymus]
MFSGQKGATALHHLKQKLLGESSFSTGSINNVPPEIELSDYQRAPSNGSESPSGLLNGESLKVEPIADLDLFFERLYSYYCEKGLWCIIIKWIVELLSLAFTICFSGFFLLFVDWNGLRSAKCGMDAVESGIKPCDLAKEALHQHPLTPLTPFKVVILGYLGITFIYWIFCFLRFFVQLKDTLEIRQFYINSLGVTDNEIQTMPWASVLEKVVRIQDSQQLCVVKDLSAHDIVMRLMRKENYLIGMLNKGVLAFPISPWIPGAGPTVKKDPNGTRYCLMLTKTLEWTLNWCILHSMFDRNFCIRKDFVRDHDTLKKRLMVVGIAMLLLSPFLVVFMLVYLFLRHAEQFYNHPSTASSRRWSNLSKWIFREYNEVDHLFKHRINSSVTHASDYLKQFPSPILSIIAKFVSFVSGGFAAILIIIAFLEESLLEGHIFGRNLFWYAAVFGAITAISRAAVSDELLVLDPHGTMALVLQHSHYMPKRWRGKENTEFVRVEFETLFQYTGKMLLEEMASIFLTPFLLIFVVPKRVDDILQFIADFTVDVEGVGHVCSFSLFDFQMHGNIKYASPHNSPRIYRSSQGKMEKSFLSFQSSYPSWEPNADGKRFLSTLKTFKEQKLQEQGIRPGYISPNRMQQWAPSLRGQGDPNSYFSRENTSQNVSKSAYQLDCIWLIDPVHKNHPYILDWYYTSCHHHHDIESGTVEVDENMANVWDPPDLRPNQNQYDENWGSFFEDRAGSNLEASTSAPLLHRSVLQHHDSGSMGQTGRSHWWARGGDGGGSRAVGPQTSFLEPPNFNHDDYDGHHDNFSNRSFEGEEEEDQQFDWRASNRLSKTFFMDDVEGGGKFDLPFDDIYDRHSESPPRTHM